MVSRIAGTTPYTLLVLLIAVNLECSSPQQIGVDVDLSVDRTNWLDPSDPLHRPSPIEGTPLESSAPEQCPDGESLLARYTEV